AAVNLSSNSVIASSLLRDEMRLIVSTMSLPARIGSLVFLVVVIIQVVYNYWSLRTDSEYEVFGTCNRSPRLSLVNKLLGFLQVCSHYKYSKVLFNLQILFELLFL